MHAFGISALPLEPRSGNPAWGLQGNTRMLVSPKTIAVFRRVIHGPTDGIRIAAGVCDQGGWSFPHKVYGSSPSKHRLLCILRAHGDKDDDEEKQKSASIDLNLPRRSMLVSFTCNACGGRSERLVNPLAWEKGMVIVQCEHCKAWHKVADAHNMVEEYRFDEMRDSDAE